MKQPNFWDETHPLTKQSEELCNALVPASGMCDTVQGELLRASSKIAYDWYNNGWGCNNWSGAVVYIGHYFSVLPVQPPNTTMQRLKRALKRVKSYSHGEPVGLLDNAVKKLVTTIHEIVVQAVLDNPALEKNRIDMWELKEPDYAGRYNWDDED